MSACHQTDSISVEAFTLRNVVVLYIYNWLNKSARQALHCSDSKGCFLPVDAMSKIAGSDNDDGDDNDRRGCKLS